ncbi:hypothetical protein [Corynebacterium anserum]|nr:hypothetical protein [Corynebacterium anserum]
MLSPTNSREGTMGTDDHNVATVRASMTMASYPITHADESRRR